MLEKPIILYVDDELFNLIIFESNLSHKYFVLTAENGVKALEILENKSDISIVVSDMRMPNMNGIEFIKRARNKFPKINYFLLTGYDITNEIEEAIKTGLILKYFSKPYNMLEIASVIEKAISELEDIS
jgi:two-component system, response regulator, stage 0 sporulation protein F